MYISILLPFQSYVNCGWHTGILKRTRVYFVKAQCVLEYLIYINLATDCHVQINVSAGIQNFSVCHDYFSRGIHNSVWWFDMMYILQLLNNNLKVHPENWWRYITRCICCIRNLSTFRRHILVLIDMMWRNSTLWLQMHWGQVRDMLLRW